MPRKKPTSIQELREIHDSIRQKIANRKSDRRIDKNFEKVKAGQGKGERNPVLVKSEQDQEIDDLLLRDLTKEDLIKIERETGETITDLEQIKKIRRMEQERAERGIFNILALRGLQ